MVDLTATDALSVHSSALLCAPVSVMSSGKDRSILFACLMRPETNRTFFDAPPAAADRASFQSATRRRRARARSARSRRRTRPEGRRERSSPRRTRRSARSSVRRFSVRASSPSPSSLPGASPEEEEDGRAAALAASAARSSHRPASAACLLTSSSCGSPTGQSRSIPSTVLRRSDRSTPPPSSWRAWNSPASDFRPASTASRTDPSASAISAGLPPPCSPNASSGAGSESAFRSRPTRSSRRTLSAFAGAGAALLLPAAAAPASILARASDA